MKRFFVILLALLSTILLFACAKGNTGSYTVDYGSSDVYTKQDMDLAIKKITDEFSDWEGCVLYSVKYMGDDVCEENLEYCNSLKDDAEFTQCMIFESSFRSPVNGGGAWEANHVYENWSWVIAREADGPWNLLTWGYG